MNNLVVLNVDDDPSQRYVKTRDLELSGFSVLEAVSGADALRKVEDHSPGVVLLDVQLPDISGHEVCAYLKEKHPEVMVLMTSATLTMPEHRTHGLEAGADCYLVQPTERIELAAAVNSLFRIRRGEDALRALNATLEKRVHDRTAQLGAANSQLTAEISQRQKAESALVQAQKMEAIGHLTGGLAHDFNNLLTAVIGNLDMIKARAVDPSVRKMADNAYRAAKRGAKLTAQLLAFSRKQKLIATPTDLNRLIVGMQELVRQTLGPSISMEMALADNLAPAYADANQIELAILNLCINSRDAMPRGGTISISTAAVDDENVSICVADNGSGMPPEIIERAFDPFFTTKPPGQGTGLGLSQVFGVIRQLGGNVEIRSEVDVGTQICLTLRRSHLAAREQADVEIASHQRYSEKILVVDDDADVRGVVTEALEQAGYNVQEASGAESALLALDSFAPDLIVVDYAMPEVNGAEVARMARARRKDVPILFMSGFPNDDELEAAAAGSIMLRKPFSPAELSSAVRSALGGRRGRSQLIN